MTVNTTQTKARRHTRDDAGPTERPRLEQRHPEQGPERDGQDHRSLPIAGTQRRRSASASVVVLAYLRLQAHALKSLEPMVRADEFDAVHQMRVATRRLRATLRSFGQVIPRSDTEQLVGELKWLGGLLGAARDGEVLSAHLQASVRTVPVELLIGPVQARVQGHFAPLRAAARAELLEALDSPRYARLLASLDHLTAGPLSGPRADDPARDVLPTAVRKAYRQADKRMRRARHTLPSPTGDVALHEARKSAAAPATRPRPPVRRSARRPAGSPSR